MNNKVYVVLEFSEIGESGILGIFNSEGSANEYVNGFNVDVDLEIEAWEVSDGA